MKLRNLFRIYVMVIGFGAALMLGSPTRAQELENTTWDDGPGVVPFAQQASIQAAATPINSDFVIPAATITEPVVIQAGVLSQSSPANEWVIGALLVFTALVVLYALTKTRRQSVYRPRH
jgi:hypothetical protein